MCFPKRTGVEGYVIGITAREERSQKWRPKRSGHLCHGRGVHPRQPTKFVISFTVKNSFAYNFIELTFTNTSAVEKYIV